MATKSITSDEREKLLNHLAENRDRIRSFVQGLSPEQLAGKPAPNRWSVAEILEHVTLAEMRVMERIKSALEQPADSENVSAWQGRDHALFAAIVDRSERFQASEFSQPQSRWPAEESLSHFEEARLRTMEFGAGTGGDLRSHFFPHPIFGMFDLYQWLLALAAHAERHRAQCEETVVIAPSSRAVV